MGAGLRPATGRSAGQRIDLSGRSDAEVDSASESAAASLQASLNLSEGPLLRAVYIDCGPERPHRLAMVGHHLVVDGVSWRILLEDLEAAYGGLDGGQPVALPPKTTSFRHWAERLEHHAGSEVLGGELGYWLDATETVGPSLPTDAQGDNTEASARTIVSTLGVDETQGLLQRSRLPTP